MRLPARGGEARREPRRADDRRDDGVAAVALRYVDERLLAVRDLGPAARGAQLRLDPRGGFGVADHRDVRRKAQALGDELLAVAVGRERMNREAFRMTRDDVERAVSDRARRTEQCQTFLHNRV